MKKTSFVPTSWKLLALCMLMVLVAACGGGSGASDSDTESATGSEGAASESAATSDEGPIKIGFMQDLSGPVEPYGKAQQQGAELAVEEINAAGGLLGRQVELVIEDLASERENAAPAIANLAGDPEVVAINGPTASTALVVAAPAAKDQEIVIVPPSSAEEFEEGVLNEWVFRTGPIQAAALPDILEQIQEISPFETMALVYDSSNQFALGEREDLKKLAGEMGFEIVAEEAGEAGDADVTGIVSSLERAKPDIVWNSLLIEQAASLMSQARDRGVEATFAGGQTFANPEIFKIAGDAGEGAITFLPFNAQSSDPQVTEFVAAFEEKFGAEPNNFSALSYDATKVIAAAIEEAGSADRTAIRDAMAGLSGVDVVTGEVTYDGGPDNTTPQFGLVQVEGGAFIPVE